MASHLSGQANFRSDVVMLPLPPATAAETLTAVDENVAVVCSAVPGSPLARWQTGAGLSGVPSRGHAPVQLRKAKPDAGFDGVSVAEPHRGTGNVHAPEHVRDEPSDPATVTEPVPALCTWITGCGLNVAVRLIAVPRPPSPGEQEGVSFDGLGRAPAHGPSQERNTASGGTLTGVASNGMPGGPSTEQVEVHVRSSRAGLRTTMRPPPVGVNDAVGADD